MARVLALEPYHGGSHAAFIDGLVKRSAHEWHVLAQPACFYKWRMRGSAITLADRAKECGFAPDVIFATDMLGVAEFMSMYGSRVPVMLYMHENQLVYPVKRQDPRDLHFGFTNITSCLAATRVVWNSAYNMQSFFDAVPGLFDMMPDQRPVRVAERIRERSLVIPPGVDLAAIDALPLERDAGPPIVVWNHRWEHDKDPETFFDATRAVLDSGTDLRVAVLGESFEEQPPAFDEARRWLGDRAVHFGYAHSRDEYLRWLKRSSVSVSTAVQENFGISAVEAAYAGAHPLWPDRLSYGELMPRSAGTDHLYGDKDDLVHKLESLVDRASRGDEDTRRWAAHLGVYDWTNVIGKYDALVDDLAGG